MRKACVIGWPVAHSRSPLIHNYWLTLYGVEGAYDRQAVQPQHLPQFLAALASLGYAGANVTLPHKEAAFQLADEADPAAQAAEAANTLWLEGAKLCASNTDIHGFLANLDEASPGWDDARGAAAVLGAGGAARGVIQGLLDRGFGDVRIINRSQEKSAPLAGKFAPRVRAAAWEDRGAALAGCALLVNATSLGMRGQPPLDLDLSALPARATVCDIVYAPLETPLLRAARARGHLVADGLGMLLHQAAPGFERWFGVKPAVTGALRALIAADLEKLED